MRTQELMIPARVEFSDTERGGVSGQEGSFPIKILMMISLNAYLA